MKNVMTNSDNEISKFTSWHVLYVGKNGSFCILNSFVDLRSWKLIQHDEFDQIEAKERFAAYVELYKKQVTLSIFKRF